MNPDRRSVVAFLFLLLSVGSGIYVSLSTLNYLQLYPALNQVGESVHIEKVTFFPGAGSSQPVLTTSIIVGNPTSYQGLRLGHVEVSISFHAQSNASATLFDYPDNLNSSQSVSTAIGPFSSITVKVSIGLTSSQASELTSFSAKYAGQTVATVTTRIDVVTFLESVTGTVPFVNVQDISLSVA